MEEINVLLREEKKRIRVWDPVVYKGMDVSTHKHVKKITLERMVRKTVPVDDAEILIRNGWTVVKGSDE